MANKTCTHFVKDLYAAAADYVILGALFAPHASQNGPLARQIKSVGFITVREFREKRSLRLPFGPQ